MNLVTQIEEALAYIKGCTTMQPSLGLILGSGLGEMADSLNNAVKIEYKDIPHFPVSTVEGHAGRLVVGELNGKTVVAMQGRFHFYEGYSQQQITFPVRVMKALGVQTLIVTNASGGLNPDFNPGLLMFIEDHINFTGDNPLIGENHSELGARFPDMSTAYDASLVALGKEVAKDLDIQVASGVHTAVSGPNYVSKAELRMIRGWNSDTIGMSTVPEVIVAVHSGMNVMGICCITDMAVPDMIVQTTHAEVMEMAEKTKPKFIRLVSEIIGRI